MRAQHTKSGIARDDKLGYIMILMTIDGRKTDGDVLVSTPWVEITFFESDDTDDDIGATIFFELSFSDSQKGTRVSKLFVTRNDITVKKLEKVFTASGVQTIKRRGGKDDFKHLLEFLLRTAHRKKLPLDRGWNRTDGSWVFVKRENLYIKKFEEVADHV